MLGVVLLLVGAGIALLAPRLNAQPSTPIVIQSSIRGEAIAPPTLTPSPSATPTATATATPSPPPSATPLVTTEPVCGPPSDWVIYIVQSGDTLSDLAVRTGTTVEQILVANCLESDLIFDGQPLYLPSEPQATEPPAITGMPESPTSVPATPEPPAPTEATPTEEATPLRTILPVTGTPPPPTISAPTETSTPATNPTQTPEPSQTPALTPAINPVEQTATAIVAQTALAAAGECAACSAATAAAVQTEQAAQAATPTSTAQISVTTPALTTSPSASALATTPTPAPTAVIIAEYAPHMDTNKSESISVVLQLAASLIPTVAQPERATEVGAAAPVGTPGARLPQAFGPAYDSVAIAQLLAPDFEVQSATAEQSLDQPNIPWHWLISPKSSGQKKVTIIVQGEWRPHDGGQPIRRQLWSHDLIIDVQELLLTQGQISLSSLLCTLLGSGLSIPWLIEHVRARRKRRTAPRQHSPSKHRKPPRKR